jgi:hypothetical protein
MKRTKALELDVVRVSTVQEFYNFLKRRKSSVFDFSKTLPMSA